MLAVAAPRWMKLGPIAPAPPPRDTFAACLLPQRGLLLVFGGDSSGLGYLSDAWTYSLITNTWFELQVC